MAADAGAGLVNRLPGPLARRKQLDHPLHLAPAAEMRGVAEPAAAPGPRRRLVRGIDAEPVDQGRRVGHRRRIGNVKAVIQGFPRLLSLSEGASRLRLSKWATVMLNAS